MSRKNLKLIHVPALSGRVVRRSYLAVLVLLVVVSIYHLYFAKKIIPGVSVGNISLGGLTYNGALQKVTQREAETIKTLSLTYNTKTYELKAEDILLEYNWEATVTRAFEVGRTGNIFVDTKDKIAGLAKHLKVPAFYDYEDALLSNFFSIVRGDINVPAADAAFAVKGMELQIIPESMGQKTDSQSLYNTVILSINNLEFGSKQLEVEQDQPDVTTEDLAAVTKEAQKIIFAPIKISHAGRTWDITPEQKATFIKYDEQSKQLGFNNVTFKTYLETIASSVDRLPKGQVTQESEGRVTGFELTEDGIKVNMDKTSEEFRRAFFNFEPEGAVSTQSVTGPVDPKKYGIYALLGEGTSKFTGSAPGRIKNLTLAASRTSGVLVPPGSIYSFNDSVGEISAATGYDAAWIILGSRTVLGHGGGVCQTSTTMFRAVLNSGLPIVERNPHAYRVRYYEIESPVGVDASIYQPSLDFRFKNDTPNYLLIQTAWNLDEQSLSFKIYGTPDGREVELSESVITSQTPPPTPLYQDDPSLAKGTVRQVDFPAWGAVAQFTRKVTKDGETLYDDVFRTAYQAWRAVYLVGTKE